MNEYYIKKNYKANKLSESNRNDYWNKERILGNHLSAQYEIYKFCQKIVRKHNMKSVMDIGCGKAEKLMKLIYPYCKKIYGIDNDENIISYCKKKYGLKLFKTINIDSNVSNLNRKFDLILSCDVIEHLNNPDNLIRFIKKHSHKNTLIVFSTPERDILRGKESVSPPNETHIREWNMMEFKRYLLSKNINILINQIVQSFKIIPIPYNIKSFFKEFKKLLLKAKRFKDFSNIKYTQLIVFNFEKIRDFEIVNFKTFLDPLINLLKSFTFKCFWLISNLFFFL